MVLYNLHSILIEALKDYLLEDNASKDIEAQKAFNLQDGTMIIPDLINYNDKNIYEVHMTGNRKSDNFLNLPSGWSGVNVFYDEQRCSETIILKEDSFLLCNYKWKPEEVTFSSENEYFSSTDKQLINISS